MDWTDVSADKEKFTLQGGKAFCLGGNGDDRQHRGENEPVVGKRRRAENARSSDGVHDIPPPAADGAEDLGDEYGKKWWDEKITFFYPGHMMDLPQMFGTMDTIAPFGKIEEIYYAMKDAIETNYPQAKFIAHFSHW